MLVLGMGTGGFSAINALGLVTVFRSSGVINFSSGGVAMALWAMFRWTRFGLATSGLAESPRSVATLGRNPGRLRLANWTIGGALAGVAADGTRPVPPAQRRQLHVNAGPDAGSGGPRRPEVLSLTLAGRLTDPEKAAE